MRPSLQGAPARFRGGLRELGDGVFAWLQPNGCLGESNAGLIVGDGESLLIDTLWDLPLTRAMLSAMVPHTLAAPIRTLVNTHGDGDHCWGNQLVGDAERIASTATRDDLLAEAPRGLRMVRMLGRLGRPPDRDTEVGDWEHPARRSMRMTLSPFGGRGPRIPLKLVVPLPRGPRLLRFDVASGARELSRQLSPYDFSGIELTPPTRTFDGTLALDVGGRRVELIEVGPAHTRGDTIVYVPDAKVVFAGDIVFTGVTPIMWSGPVGHWMDALDRIETLRPTTVVPGHGPVSDRSSVTAMRDYWDFVAAEVRERLAAGAEPLEAATRILGSSEFRARGFDAWDVPKRLVVNAHMIARSDAGDTGRLTDRERLVLLGLMGQLSGDGVPVAAAHS